jgi:hypothetical protein
MVRRPDQPAGERVATVIDALSWVEDRLAS